MRLGGFLSRNLAWYWRTNLAVVAGAAVATAVLCGALLVGDSVRASLRRLAVERLGAADYALVSTGYFDNALAASFDGLARAVPFLALEAAVRHELSRRHATAVAVYGADESFFAFHGMPAPALSGREALLSPALARELGAAAGDALVLRFAAPSALPREFLHGRRDLSTQAIRATVGAAVSPAALAEFALRPQQGGVRAVFLRRELLGRELGHPGQANTLLLSGKATGEALAARLRESVSLAGLELKTRNLSGSRGVSLEHASTLLEAGYARRVREAAQKAGVRAQPLFTYLVNTIGAGSREVPYSLVTAVSLEDFATLGGGSTWPEDTDPPVVLSQWAARELAARPGDVITLEYYYWKPEGLETRRNRFRLAGIAPSGGLAADRDVAPDYPGITDSLSLAEWDPPFPLDLKRIRPADEDYWKRYRTTPKAWIPIDEGRRLWGTRFGDTTAIRLHAPEEAARALALSAARPLESPFSLLAVRAEALAASSGSTDFGAYFLYFSFFLVVSGLLLTALFARLSIELRLAEIGLLRSLGFTPADLGRIFLGEATALAGAGAVLGVAGALGYAALLLCGLRTWWVDAVGTELITLSASPLTMIGGASGGFLCSLGAAAWALRGVYRVSPRRLLGARLAQSGHVVALTGGVALLGGVVLIVLGATGVLPAAGGFFGSGSLLLVACLCGAAMLLRMGGPRLDHGGSLTGLGLRNAGWRPGRSLLCVALLASATFLIVSLESFRRDPSAEGEAQGFNLLGESQAPLLYDPATARGRAALNLDALPALRWELFRLRPGDDVSCLNLYAPRNPRVLGARSTYLEALGVRAQLEAVPVEGVVPAAVDSNSLTYILHREVGDIIDLPREGAPPIRLQIAAALNDSIFQGELIIAEREFLRLFPEIEGFRVFLLDAPPQAAGELEDALADFGFDATSVAERMAAFHRVENTYLSTFQALGGLGVLLGTFGLGAVLFRNLLERRRELALLRALGYTPGEVRRLAMAETLLLLAAGLVAGLGCAVLAVAPALAARGAPPPVARIVVLLALVLAAGAVSALVAARAATRAPLLAALRSE